MQPAKQSGFSLLEIAIVIVLTCLLGTIMVIGHNFTLSSKVNRLRQDFNSLQAVLYETQISSSTKEGNLLRISSPSPDTATTHNTGNRHAGILEDWKSASGEAFNLWKNTSPVDQAKGSVNANTYVPFGLSGAHAGKSRIAHAPIAGLTSNFIICTNNINGRLVKQLDLAMDNGNTASGSMMVSSTFGGMGIATGSIVHNSRYMVCLGA